jgi:hypothetical protein
VRPAALDRGLERIANGTRPAWLLLVLTLVAGCASGPQVTPVAGEGVALDPEARTAAVESEGVQLVVRSSAWRGSPAFLPGYVTPFHLLLTNGAAQPLHYDYVDLRLFDDQRFQYTALPPVEVGRLLRWSGPDILVAAAGPMLAHRRRAVIWDPFWDPWWGWGGWGWPYWPYWQAPLSVEDVLAQALPVGPLEGGARREGFVYFPRLRAEVRGVFFEMRYRLGGASHVFRLPFGVRL